jgi:nitrite reductase (NO-forming)
VRPRSILSVYQLASRTWLVAAGLSLLLPASARLGIWLPLHLALAGAVSVAISGAMQNFAATLTATPAMAAVLVWTQFALVNLGAGLVAAGLPTHRPGIVVAGGVSFLSAILLLGWAVARAWRTALNRRHVLPMATYGAAIVAVLVGVTLGAIVGSGTVSDPSLWLGLRRAHMVLNVLGWASLTICGTLVTLLPTVLRVQMPSWHGTGTIAALAVGVAALPVGLAASSTPTAAAGGVAYAAGALGVAWMIARTLRVPRTWPVPVAAKHLLLAAAWFVAGSLSLMVALLHGITSFDGFRSVFLTVFVGGWVLQTLLGAWQYLLPMSRPGHPDERRRFLAVMEFARRLQLLALNAGLVLTALRGAGWVSDTLGSIGVGLAIGGGALALVKAWAYPVLARTPVLTRRELDVWGA